MTLTRRSALLSAAATTLVPGSAAWAATQIAGGTTPDAEVIAERVDALVRRAMESWPDQPALGISVVKDGQTVLARGYGVKVQGQAAPADEHTLFAIASNTKNVTASALAILVDEGKVKWDEPVRTYWPEFSLSKPELDGMVTVRDLLSHRIGFGLGAGDLLFWPNAIRTRKEIIDAIPHVPIEDGFRANYHYCNLMFVAAGHVIERVSGQPWEDFIQSRILNPVGMTETAVLTGRADPAKSALPHARIGPPLRYQGEMVKIADSIVGIWDWDNAAAAGALCASPHDWAKWIAVRLKDGELPDGTRLFSADRSREMLRPNIISGSSPGPTAELPGRSIAATYAMGLAVQDYRGERLVSHGGGSPGGISATVMLPGRGVGFSIFSNAEESFLLRALRSGIADICMAAPEFDWIGDSKRREQEGITASLAAAAEIDARQAAGAPHAFPPPAYAGTWRDPWYGDVEIRHENGRLWLAFTRSPALQGPLEPYDGETFRTRFPDKREEDAFITFEAENGRPVRATVKGVSPDIDFSYDYQDLRLTRLN